MQPVKLILYIHTLKKVCLVPKYIIESNLIKQSHPRATLLQEVAKKSLSRYWFGEQPLNDTKIDQLLDRDYFATSYSKPALACNSKFHLKIVPFQDVVGVGLGVWVEVCGYVGVGSKKFDLMTGGKINHQKRQAYAYSRFKK